MTSHHFTPNFKTLTKTGMGLTFGVIFGLGNGVSLAQTLSQSPVEIAQTNPQRPDVVIDNGNNSATNSDPRFTCEFVNGQYTVMYNPDNQAGQGYPWAVPTEMGGGWTPQARCETISKRLESYRPDGLVELQTGMENNYSVVCATTEANPSCRIVFTVPPGQDPLATRDRVFQNLTVADSGQTTQGVTTYTAGEAGSAILGQLGQVLGGNNSILGNLGQLGQLGNLGQLGQLGRSMSDGIPLRPFLAPSDGGTGERLGMGGFSQPSGARLNPDRFR